MARMEEADRLRIEEELSELAGRGEHGQVAEHLVRRYGPEIFGFIAATLGDHTAAEDVFSIFCEQVLRGARSFQGKSSFRTWAFTVARNAAYQYRLAERRRGRREIGLPDSSPLFAVAARVRTETAGYLKTEVKSRFAALRDELSEDDRALLVLRVDKGLGFEDIATILGGANESLAEGASLKREAARLRKRYQLVKEKLVELGRREGLLRDE